MSPENQNKPVTIKDGFDGLTYEGQLVGIREIKRNKDGKVIVGIANIDLVSTRGDQTITATKQIKTMMGSFDKTDEFNTLTDARNIGKHFVIAVGEQSSGGFTNLVALFVSEV
jgi:hypothetical protein